VRSRLHRSRLTTVSALLALLPLAGLAAGTTAHEPLKKAAIGSVEEHASQLIDLSDQIWGYAETAFRETRSAKALADYAERQGFRVERGVDAMPTAFIAEYGSGKPVIGIVGEYDALPGISQQAQPTQAPLEAGAAGHGCGHNLFGAGSLGAAVAIKELIEDGKLKGTIRFYGTPAEEDVGGKIYLTRDGAFNGVDVMLAWHPETSTRADMVSNQAIMDVAVVYKGRAAHAASDPWNGRSAADAAEAFTFGINLLREHVRPTVRMHYVVQDAGDVPNVVPQHARVWLWVRDESMQGVEAVLKRIEDIAKGAALVAGVEYELIRQNGTYQLLINEAGARALDANLRYLGPIRFSAEDEAFAKELQRSAGSEPTGLDTSITALDAQEFTGGSTDVGDMSWVVPTLHLSVVTAPNVPWHAWPVVAASGMSIGHTGMLYAAKTLALTMVDLYEEPRLRQAVRAEFEADTKGFTYKAYVPDGPPPMPQ
jgi:aminobenzoyl-glutamate utilization protein B